jgi:hypothetical protein
MTRDLVATLTGWFAELTGTPGALAESPDEETPSPTASGEQHRAPTPDELYRRRQRSAGSAGRTVGGGAAT